MPKLQGQAKQDFETPGADASCATHRPCELRLPLGEHNETLYRLAETRPWFGNFLTLAIRSQVVPSSLEEAEHSVLEVIKKLSPQVQVLYHRGSLLDDENIPNPLMPHRLQEHGIDFREIKQHLHAYEALNEQLQNIRVKILELPSAQRGVVMQFAQFTQAENYVGALLQIAQASRQFYCLEEARALLPLELASRAELLVHATRYRALLDSDKELSRDELKAKYPEILGIGQNGIVLRVEAEGKAYALKLPRSHLSLHECEAHMLALHVQGVVQCVDVHPALHPYERYLVMEIAAGKEISKYTPAERKALVSDEHIRKLYDTFCMLEEKGIQVDTEWASNLFFHKDAGFQFVDIGRTPHGTTVRYHETKEELIARYLATEQDNFRDIDTALLSDARERVLGALMRGKRL